MPPKKIKQVATKWDDVINPRNFNSNQLKTWKILMLLKRWANRSRLGYMCPRGHFVHQQLH